MLPYTPGFDPSLSRLSALRGLGVGGGMYGSTPPMRAPMAFPAPPVRMPMQGLPTPGASGIQFPTVGPSTVANPWDGAPVWGGASPVRMPMQGAPTPGASGFENPYGDLANLLALRSLGPQFQNQMRLPMMQQY